MNHKTVARAALGALVAMGLLAVANPAGAHTTVTPSEASAGGYTTVYFQVPHGCDGEPTNVVSVQLTEDIQSVKAEMVPGWTATYTKAPLSQPFESYGRQITEYVSAITWTADGAPLPDDQFMRFGVSMKVPDAPGEQLLLPAVQTCPSGAQEAWIDPNPDSDSPAPQLTLTAASGDGHGGGSGMADNVSTTETAAATTTSESSSSPAALIVAIIALVVAAIAGVLAIGNRKQAS